MSIGDSRSDSVYEGSNVGVSSDLRTAKQVYEFTLLYAAY
jgi:hypothetical protein